MASNWERLAKAAKVPFTAEEIVRELSREPNAAAALSRAVALGASPESVAQIIAEKFPPLTQRQQFIAKLTELKDELNMAANVLEEVSDQLNDLLDELNDASQAF